MLFSEKSQAIFTKNREIVKEHLFSRGFQCAGGAEGYWSVQV